MAEENHENTQSGRSPSRDLNLESIEFKAEWMLDYVIVFGSSESRQRPILMLQLTIIQMSCLVTRNSRLFLCYELYGGQSP